MSHTTMAPLAPHKYEDLLIEAVHRQALVLLLIEPDGYQRTALRAYAEAAQIDYSRDFEDEVETVEAEVAMLATKVAEQDRKVRPSTVRAVVSHHLRRAAASAEVSPDDAPPTSVERNVCAHCGRPIERTNVRPAWSHVEGRIGSRTCASAAGSPVATPRDASVFGEGV